MKDLEPASAIERALVIRDPWISHILEGHKTWEMRGRSTKIRGLIGLIRQGSGLVVGVAELVGSLPPLDKKDFGEHVGRHCIPVDMHDEVIHRGWVFPWVLSSVKPLAKPVRYQHKSGAVTFVKLTQAVSSEIRRQLEAGPKS